MDTDKTLLELIKTKMDKESPSNVEKDWQLKRGTKEAEISEVRSVNRWGIRKDRFKTGEPLTVDVIFKAKNKIIEPHFGIAIFRRDQVYCCGPNTVFDDIKVTTLNPGPGRFSVRYQDLLLSPGEYYISAAIWNQDESKPYDYHCACYKVEITGERNDALYNERYICAEVSDKEKKGGKDGILLTLINKYGDEKDVFKTNSGMKLILENINSLSSGRDDIIKLYREDGLLCFQIKDFLNRRAFIKNSIKLEIPALHLLPGVYKIYIGDKETRRFSVYSEIRDHGVVYMSHKWDIKIP